MLKKDECSYVDPAEYNSDFTASLAFNYGAWVGFMYFIFIPTFFILAIGYGAYAILSLTDDIFYEILIEPIASNFKYVAFIFFLIFIGFLFIVSPIKNLKYDGFGKSFMIFSFIMFLFVSFVSIFNILASL